MNSSKNIFLNFSFPPHPEAGLLQTYNVVRIFPLRNTLSIEIQENVDLSASHYCLCIPK